MRRIMLEPLIQDVRYGLRTLLKTPALAVTAILSLAIGIGAATTMFAVIDAALLRQIPVRAPEDLVFLFTGTEESPYGNLPYPDFEDLLEAGEGVVGLAAYAEIQASLAVDDDPALTRGVIATGNFFDVLGVSAALGRTFTSADDQAPGEHPVAVISHALFERRFGGDSTIVNADVTINGRPYTVLGVTPEGFHGPEVLENYEIYVPMAMQPHVRPPRGSFSSMTDPVLLDRRDASWLRVVGRLASGISIEAAVARLEAVATRLQSLHPETNRGETVSLFPVSKLDPRAWPILRAIAWLLMSVGTLVLLVASANVTSLLLAWGVTRRKEIATRLALGGSRLRILRQLLTESLVLAFLGGALGVVAAQSSLDALARFVPQSGIFSFTLDPSIDFRVLFFALLASTLTAVFSGLLPAFQSSRSDLTRAIKDSAGDERRGSRLTARRGLVLAQLALSIVLLAGAGLFLQSFWRSAAIAPGFDSEAILTARLPIDVLQYPPARARQFYDEVLERVSALPSVSSASVTRIVPLAGGGRRDVLSLEHAGPGEPEIEILTNVVGPHYFRTMGIGLVAGREFEPRDDENAPPVALVNESFVSRYFPDGRPLGRRLRLGGDEAPWRDIVGVVRDSKYRNLSEPGTPFVYEPLAQRQEIGMVLLARTTVPPALLAGPVRDALLAIEPNLPIAGVEPLHDLVRGSLYPARMGARLISLFALTALVLAAVGLYGVVSFAVSRRTRELGIRMALGARPRELIGALIAETMVLVLAGATLGWLAAAVASWLLTRFLFGVERLDAATFVVVSVVLIGVMLVTTYVPARRAARTDPLRALRHE